MLALDVGLVALALLGHAALWVGLVNRWHATGYRRKVVKLLTLPLYAAFLLIPPVVAWGLYSSWRGSWAAEGQGLNWASGYVVFAAAYGAAHSVLWAWRRIKASRLPPGVESLGLRVENLEQRLGFKPVHGPRTTFMSRIPGNQLWQLEISEFSVRVPGLPAALDGLSICHLSDLHISGRLDRGYYHEVAVLTNELKPDVVALTGDLCDARHLIPWVTETLLPIEARVGKFFVLGNHDLRTRAVDALRAAAEAAGFVDVSGRHVTPTPDILIAGDERPWFQEAPHGPDLPDHMTADRTSAGAADEAEPHGPQLKLLLAHTPDQLSWARRQGFDLMLAGHTHGGQIRFPLIGPVVCPSWHGTRYSSGFFDERPTLLHTSRGTGSLMPLRWNCPPEITKLVLRSA